MWRRVLPALFCVGVALTLIQPSPPLTARPVPKLEPAVTGDPAPDLSQFPKLTGKVKHQAVSGDGSGWPQAGQTFALDLARLDKLGTPQRPGVLAFGPGHKNDIHLPGPMTVEAIHYDFRKDTFAGMRLVFDSDGPPQGVTRLVMDVRPARGDRWGPSAWDVWVVAESEGLTAGAVLIECEADGAFPAKPPPPAPAAEPADGEEKDVELSLRTVDAEFPVGKGRREGTELEIRVENRAAKPIELRDLQHNGFYHKKWFRWTVDGREAACRDGLDDSTDKLLHSAAVFARDADVGAWRIPPGGRAIWADVPVAEFHVKTAAGWERAITDGKRHVVRVSASPLWKGFRVKSGELTVRK